jgi:hypothetical protein
VSVVRLSQNGSVFALNEVGYDGPRVNAGSARSTVQECLRRAREAGLTLPLPDDGAHEARLYPCLTVMAPGRLLLRQNHVPGEKVFVDYAGQTVPIIDRYSGA